MAGKKIRQRTSSTSAPGPGGSVPNAPPPVTRQQQPQRSTDDLAGLTKQQLQVECRKRGQKTTGTKVELLQRLGHKMSSKRNITLTNVTANGNSQQPLQQKTEYQKSKQREKEEREGLVIWKRPLKTAEYFVRELLVLIYTYGKKSLQYRKILLFLFAVMALSIIAIRMPGPHQVYMTGIYKKLFWCSYWIGLGILSSVGLGTGLHTFLLYLGPHIAQVTLAAYECGSLDFPEPPYPDEIICPTGEKGDSLVISIFAIMSKVRLEAMCWGAGTALGELPPYFMAKAARLSGIDPDDEDDDLAEIEELQKKRREDLTIMERGKLFVEHIVQKVGFFGILACASIPNPLFDLAGITCGHFLVPFWTFFGATLIGKAIIKMHIQKLFVIIAFNETLINKALSWLTVVPVIGDRLEMPFRTFLNGQKSRLHAGGASSSSEGGGGGFLGAIFEKFVFAMILYFVVSIVNSFAQSFHKRMSKRKPGKSFKD